MTEPTYEKRYPEHTEKTEPAVSVYALECEDEKKGEVAELSETLGVVLERHTVRSACLTKKKSSGKKSLKTLMIVFAINATAFTTTSTEKKTLLPKLTEMLLSRRWDTELQKKTMKSHNAGQGKQFCSRGFGTTDRWKPQHGGE